MEIVRWLVAAWHAFVQRNRCWLAREMMPIRTALRDAEAAVTSHTPGLRHRFVENPETLLNELARVTYTSALRSTNRPD